MLNNTFEEMFNPSKLPNVKEIHEKIIEKMVLPPWTGEIKCPYCKENMPKTSIRSISLKLNPRNIGDICVEFLCSKCQVGNTLYFTKAANNIKDFIYLLENDHEPYSIPITEEEMYKQKYHNVLDFNIKGELV